MLLFSPDFTKATQAHQPHLQGTNPTTAKSVVYVVGDFNNWTPSEAYKLYRDRDGWDGTTDADGDGDRGDYWWIEINGLQPGQNYVFQYLMDGALQIADPFATQICDPEDVNIPSSVYPNLPAYPSQAIDRAAVINTVQEVYNWSAPVFQKAVYQQSKYIRATFSRFYRGRNLSGCH